MRDLGSAGAKAIAGCHLEAVPDLVCHYHFLAVVGRKLLDVEYAALRGQLRRSKVRSGLRELLRAVRGRAGVRADLAALILWVLEGTGHKDLPYPFALPHWDFYRRCGQFRRQARRWLPGPRSPAGRRALRQVPAVLAALGRRARIAWSVPRLERRWAVFNQLRTILRLRDDELPRGSRPVPRVRGPAATAAHLQAIETAAKTYHDELRQQVAAQQPCRTDHRPHLGRDMEDQPAQAALAANLLCPHYVRIVCGTLDRLPQAFAELDRQAIKASTPLQRNNKDAQLRKRIRAWAATDE